MRPTLTVNLGGLQFTFNDNAYRLMSEYLQSLSDAFRAQGLDAAELCADIENRCAEILAETHDRATYIVTEGDITSLIDRMGRPEEILDEQVAEGPGFEQVKVKETVVPPPYIPKAPQPLRKRLYRVRQGAELGGVCGGIAAYCGWDPTYVRIAAVLLAILSASTVGIAYLVLWIVVPQAKTPLQEMELRGESPTLNNIGNTVKQAFGFKEGQQGNVAPQAPEVPFEKLNPGPPRHASRLVRFFAGVGKCLLGFVALVFICIVIALITASIGGIIWGITMLVSGELPPHFFQQMGIVLTGTVIVGIPLSMASWWIIRSLFHLSQRWQIKPAWRLTLFVTWLITLFICIKFVRVYSSALQAM